MTYLRLQCPSLSIQFPLALCTLTRSGVLGLRFLRLLILDFLDLPVLRFLASKRNRLSKMYVYVYSGSKYVIITSLFLLASN